jgi:hypothetical protein
MGNMCLQVNKGDTIPPPIYHDKKDQKFPP